MFNKAEQRVGDGRPLARVGRNRVEAGRAIEEASCNNNASLQTRTSFLIIVRTKV